MQFHAQLAASSPIYAAQAEAQMWFLKYQTATNKLAAMQPEFAAMKAEHAARQAEHAAMEAKYAAMQAEAEHTAKKEPELEQQPTAAAVQETPELEQHPTAAVVQDTAGLELQITAAVPIDRTSASFARTRQTARQQTDSRAVRVEPAAEQEAEPAFHPDCSIYDSRLEFDAESHEDCLANGGCFLQCGGIVDWIEMRRCTEGGEWETVVHPYGNIRLCFACGDGYCLGSGYEAVCELCSDYVEAEAEDQDNHSRASSEDNHSGASTPVN